MEAGILPRFCSRFSATGLCVPPLIACSLCFLSLSSPLVSSLHLYIFSLPLSLLFTCMTLHWLLLRTSVSVCLLSFCSLAPRFFLCSFLVLFLVVLGPKYLFFRYLFVSLLPFPLDRAVILPPPPTYITDCELSALPHPFRSLLFLIADRFGSFASSTVSLFFTSLSLVCPMTLILLGSLFSCCSCVPPHVY